MVIFVSGTIQADLILLCRNITNAYSCGWKFSEKPHFLEAPFFGERDDKPGDSTVLGP